jgi:hypothetical protein
MDGATANARGKPLNRAKIGQEFLLAYDESKKMLAVVSSDKVYSLTFCIRVVEISHVHSSYCTFLCSTTRGDFRQWEAQSTCIRGTTMRCLFALHAL